MTDPFSDVLRLAEATSVASGGLTAGGRWALQCPPPARIKFMALVKGACWLRVGNQRKPVGLEQGDVVLLSGRDGFLLASDLAVAPIDAVPLFAAAGSGFVKVGTGSDCTILVGQVVLDATSGVQVTDALPALVHVRALSPQAAMLRWIVDQILHERSSPLPGASIASAQLAQLMFIQVLRAHVASTPGLPPGWLRAVSDERLLPALRLIHGDPRRTWTLSTLAKAAGMSRTSFAVHFKAVAAVPPLAYLTSWRMQLAQRRLRDDTVSVAQLADALGYASESAFSHAFKRVTGTGPRNYRDASRLVERSRKSAGA